MPINLEHLKRTQQDYYIARWEDNELVMEPFCFCGNALDEDFFCKKCDRECDCTFVACCDPQSLSVAEKLINGSPSFRNFKISMLENKK